MVRDSSKRPVMQIPILTRFSNKWFDTVPFVLYWNTENSSTGYHTEHVKEKNILYLKLSVSAKYYTWIGVS